MESGKHFRNLSLTFVESRGDVPDSTIKEYVFTF